MVFLIVILHKKLKYILILIKIKMNWLMNLIWDYFPTCKECKKHEEEKLEILKMIEDLVKTQSEIIIYLRQLKKK